MTTDSSVELVNSLRFNELRVYVCDRMWVPMARVSISHKPHPHPPSRFSYRNQGNRSFLSLFLSLFHFYTKYSSVMLD